MSSYPPVESVIPLATLDAIPHPALLYRSDGVLVGYNTAAEEFYGVPREPVLNKFNMFETPEILEERIVESVKNAFAGRTIILPLAKVDVSKSESLSQISKKTTWTESSFIPLRDAEGNVPYVLILMRDMTELAEQRIATEQAWIEVAAQRERNDAARREIEEQQATILALESPIIEVGDGILTLPVIGIVTERRAADMMNKVLAVVTAKAARYLILDLTGSDHVDADTAGHFSSIMRAVALLGAQGIVVGIRAPIAQTMISLGLDLSGARIYRNLREALAQCSREIERNAGSP